jgi:WD40 repeat protein
MERPSRILKVKNKIRVMKFIILLIVISNPLFAQDSIYRPIIWSTDWSPNGKFIVIGENNDSLKIYSEKDFKPYKSFPINNTITLVKWHPSKNTIAVTTQISKDKSSIINLETDEEIELNGISSDGARGMDWNYTGEYLAVGDNDGQILIYNTKGELIRKFLNQTNSTKSITALDWHPKKNILITVSDKIRFFDIEGNLLNTVKHRPEDVLILSVVWHKSGDFFVTGDYGDEKDKSLLQYWSEQGKLIRSIDISKGEYRNLAWNPKGTRLATASDTLRIWDTEGNLIYEGNEKNHFLWGVSWNKLGNKIITSAQSVLLWNNKAEKIETVE